MKKFPHLPLIKKVTGTPRRYGGGKPNQITQENTLNNNKHGTALLNKISSITFEPTVFLGDQERKFEYSPTSKAVFLSIDPSEVEIEEFVKKLNLELISEEEKGFVIGSGDKESFGKLKEKIESFSRTCKYKSYIPKLWDIEEGDGWRLEHILSKELLDDWDKLNDTDILLVELSIAVNPKIEKRKNLDQETQIQIYDNESIERQNLLESFLFNYSGSLESSYLDCNDSFSCIVKISVKGLKDIVLNYPYLFEVTLKEEIESEITVAKTDSEEMSINFIPPDTNAPAVCIMDSGMQESHIYISDAVEPSESTSFVPKDSSTADHVAGGGHGTRVAGVVALGMDFAKSHEVKHELRIQNARVLNGQNRLTETANPAVLMRQIVNHYYQKHGTKIFNLSINSATAFTRKHMSTWAAEIDKLTYENDILFIISVGNVSRTELTNYFQNGVDYPDYFAMARTRIANPAISCFSISVGSIAHIDYETEFEKSISTKNSISAFSRSGPGLWGMIKPEVVAYGGDYVKEKLSNGRLTTPPQVCPLLIRSTLNGGPALSRDCVGTSFSTPQISRIAGLIAKEFPTESTLFYRALIAHSTEELKGYGESDEKNFLVAGYGLHSSAKCLKNNAHRITFYSSDTIGVDEAMIYCVNIPDSLRFQSLSNKYLIEITMAFKAKPRRTRHGTRSYLSTWLSWETSKIDETFDNFDTRMRKIEEEYDKDGENLKWRIGQYKKNNQPFSGRNGNTLQRDWAVINAYELNAEFGVAVKGHKGWDKSGKDKVEFSIIVSIEDLGSQLQVYEQIRLENQIDIQNEIEIRL